jgi:hypothetical protein
MTITILDIATSLNRFIAREERDISGLDAFFGGDLYRVQIFELNSKNSQLSRRVPDRQASSLHCRKKAAFPLRNPGSYRRISNVCSITGVPQVLSSCSAMRVNPVFS